MLVFFTFVFLQLPIAHKVSELDKQMEEEAKILHNIKESSALMSVTELAKGVLYTEPLTTGWVVEVIQSAVVFFYLVLA